jgi:WD40 repeat protein/GTPase SAR1 family protein
MFQQSPPNSPPTVKHHRLFFNELLSWFRQRLTHRNFVLLCCLFIYFLFSLSHFILLIIQKGPINLWSLSLISEVFFIKDSYVLLWLVAIIVLIIVIWPIPRFLRRKKTNSITLLHTFSHNTNQILSVSWSPTGHLVASATSTGTIHLWDIDTGTLHQIIEKRSSPVWKVSWSPDGQTLASTYLDGTLCLFDTETTIPRHILSGHSSLAWSITWSPDGQTLASGSLDGTICLWDVQTGASRVVLSGHTNSITMVAWSPDGQTLASGSLDSTVQLLDIQTGALRGVLSGHTTSITMVAWSPDGQTLASGSLDGTIRLWDAKTDPEKVIQENIPLTGFSWSPQSHYLACNCSDHTVKIWNASTSRITHVLEGHTHPISQLAFSSDERLLASLSFPDADKSKGMLRIWRTDSWECIAVLNDLAGNPYLAFHPQKALLVTPGTKPEKLSLQKLDIYKDADTSAVDTISYTNAKIVLVGDSGVGKSGLALALMEQPFKATESTHGRHIWTLDEQNIYRHGKCEETREILLWDLAGQPGYRLIHQLHLDEVAVALLVFDARSETDPFAGVFHWDKALRQAQRTMKTSMPPLKKLLVAARTDRGGIGVGTERLQTLMKEFAFTSYFETSAKESYHIADLKKAIQEAIEWDMLPKISSTHLFRNIKAFLVSEKAAGRLLVTIDVLYSLYVSSKHISPERENLRSEFETCIGRVEAAGFIKSLSFGNMLLLQPELIDAYASALINAVKDEPDGLGSILEERVRTADFRLPGTERLMDKQQEKLLLITMVEDLLQRELVLREEAFLVFPSQSTRENPYLPNAGEKTIIFEFEGSVLNIYATLTVRLANSGMFKKKELWKNAVTYTTSVGGMCGVALRTISEAHGELTLFFDQIANEQTQFHFEEYVQSHLQHKALSESIRRRRIFVCKDCGAIVTEQVVQLRVARGFEWLNCSVCSAVVSLLDREKRLTGQHTSLIQVMDRAADRQRSREMLNSILQGKRASGEFDVFLCHNDEDKLAVKQIGEQLKERGILPWLDEWELRPGLPWQRTLEERITTIKSVAVFIGQEGIGPWEHFELDAFLRQFVKRKCPVIPVLLPETPKKPQLPLFLEGMTWVDLRLEETDSFERLLWGITGEKHE